MVYYIMFTLLCVPWLYNIIVAANFILIEFSSIFEI